MNLRRLVIRSLRHYWRTGIVVVFGLAVATAVIVGSLVIGDSVTGSIRRTALSRLGSIDYALVGHDYFRRELADDLASVLEGEDGANRAVPLIITQGAARNPSSDVVVPKVEVVGITDAFWGLHEDSRALGLSGREVAINAALASDAGVAVGDYLLLTVGSKSKVPTDSLFARRSREDAVRSMRVRVTAVLTSEGVGGFRLDAGTATPRNLFISLGWLASRLSKEGQANALVADLGPAAQAALARETRESLFTWQQWIEAQFNNPAQAEALVREMAYEGRPVTEPVLAKVLTLADYGLKLVDEPDSRYLWLQSEGVLLRPAEAGAALQPAASSGSMPRLSSVYIADSIRRADADAGAPELAYAMVAWVEDTTRLTSVAGEVGDLEWDEFALNSWAAEDLGASIGEQYELAYLVPSFEQGYRTETVELTLGAIVDMTGLGAEPDLVPDFEGITDAERIDDWDPPFPVDLRRITDRDEEYWDRYRAAPKAFVSRHTMTRMWRSATSDLNYGFLTSISVWKPPREGFMDEFNRRLLANLYKRTGPRLRSVRQQALAASKGTSDFGQLFLGMSMFLVLSGAGLAGMLMRLSADRRASEAGIMMACGFTAGTAGRTVFAEGTVLTVLGVLLGTPLGIVYAWAIVSALGSWWGGALGETAALWLFARPSSIIEGAAAGLLVGLLAAGWGARKLGRSRVLDLLSGWQAMLTSPTSSPRRWASAALACALVGALVLLGLSTFGEGVAPEVAFFASGAALLVAGVAGASLALTRAARMRGATRSPAGLSVRNAAASPGRSLLVVGLLACATFVVVAVAANSRDFAGVDLADRSSGTGGFALLATSSVPLTYDFGTPEGRERLGFSPEDEAAFEGVEVISFLVSPGEDISCLNIARPSRPRVLGVPDKMIDRGGFRVRTERRVKDGNPWKRLRSAAREGEFFTAAFGDAASVRWQLHSGLGQRYRIEGQGGRTASVEFTGLLSASIFQSEILLAEDEFRAIYPGVDAPSYFLIDTPPGTQEQVSRALRVNLGEMGLEVHTTREVLNAYLGVQNTYLSMFLALGGLGLLLGSVGMVAVLLRSALERRGEFALMLATGFRRGQIARLLVSEHGGLLLAGIAWGSLSALVAVAPQLASAASRVNWNALAVVLVSVLITGLLACALAARWTVRGSLIEALREE